MGKIVGSAAVEQQQREQQNGKIPRKSCLIVFFLHFLSTFQTSSEITQFFPFSVQRSRTRTFGFCRSRGVEGISQKTTPFQSKLKLICTASFGVFFLLAFFLRTTITTITHTLLVKLCDSLRVFFFFLRCCFSYPVCFFFAFIDAQLLCKQAAPGSATRRNAGGGQSGAKSCTSCTGTHWLYNPTNTHTDRERRDESSEQLLQLDRPSQFGNNARLKISQHAASG